MKTLYALGLVLLLAFTVTGCQLYFGEDGNSDDESYCAADGYYVRGEWVSAQCPGGGNACDSNTDCAAGCFCDATKKTCDEAGFCSDSKDCSDGFYCDERSSCVPGGGSCTGELAPTCTNGAPTCEVGMVPLIENGCYFDRTGDGQFDCVKIAECGAPPACEALQHQTDCTTAGATCTSVSRGVNCRMPSGAACQDGVAGCVCERYVFDRCETL